MSRYENYKQVDLPWMKEIPSHWEIDRAKNHFTYRKELNKDNFEKNILSLTLGGVIKNDIENPIGLVPKDYSTYQLFNRGDLVFKLIDLNNVKTSRVGLVLENGAMSSAYIRLIKNSKNYYEKYFYYWYYKLYLEEVYNKLGSGVRETIGKNELLLLEIPLPPLKEQEQIANYLDWKINEIDKLIAKEKEKIKEVEILKSTSIYKLLDIENGKKIKIKHFCNLFGRIGWQGLNSSEYSNNKGILLVTGTDFKSGEIDYKTCVRVPFFRWEQNKNIQLKNNDLLITKDGSVGKLAIVKNLEEKATLNSGIMKIEFFNESIVTKEYLYYILKSDIFKKWFYNLNLGVATIIHLYQRDFYNFEFIYPDINEQEVVVKKIKKIEDSFDKVLNDLKIQIQNLESLKQSLISEVVTGQIDVRDVKIPVYEKFEIDNKIEKEVEEDD